MPLPHHLNQSLKLNSSMCTYGLGTAWQYFVFEENSYQRS